MIMEKQDNFMRSLNLDCIILAPAKNSNDDEIGAHFGFREMHIQSSWGLFTLDSKVFTSKSISNVE